MPTAFPLICQDSVLFNKNKKELRQVHGVVLITVHQQMTFFSGAIFPGLFMCKEALRANMP